MNDGVIYYNKGKKCIVRLILCIQSLREHYDGNITVFIEGPQPTHLLHDLRKQFGVSFIDDSNSDVATLVRKIQVSRKSPYERTLFIDADMLVMGDISEFFEQATDCDLVASHFTDWKSNGGTIRRRIKRFQEYRPECIDAAINFGPAINTGIYAFNDHSRMWDEWFEVAQWGQEKGIYIPDEVSCQVLTPKYNVKVLPSKYNVSVVYGNHIDDKRVIHYHGRKHCKDFPLCELWIERFKKACEENLCHIRNYVSREYGDRRLSNFLKGKYGWSEHVSEINNILAGKRRVKKQKKAPLSDKVTIVTSVDTNYVKFLKETLPNWVKYKNVDQYPMIVYVNGFERGADDRQLRFIKKLCPKAQIIEWDLEAAESQRERMLSTFVYGAARDVRTPYWVKMDADGFATNDKPLLDEEMLKYDICGHKWHYTKPGTWIRDLDEWAGTVKKLKDGPNLFDSSQMGEKRYIHERTASFIQLHKTDFTQLAASLAPERLPVPSQDTYLWYVAKRLDRKIKRHNFKRFRGFSNIPRIKKLKDKLIEIEQENSK